MTDTTAHLSSYLQRRRLAEPTSNDAAAVAAHVRSVIADAPPRETIEYLTVTKAAEHSGVKRSAFQWHPLPRPDATFGEGFEGWLPETIDWWSAERESDGAILGGEAIEYWGPFDVAAFLDIDRTTLARYRIPAPDGRVGRRSGWLPGTIVAWNLVRENIKDPIAEQI